MSKALKSSTCAEPGNPSPHINALAWGRIEVNGIGTFRDAKVFPGGAREWDWNETGTAHKPGIQPADVAELLDHGATTIVLSQGMLNRLHVCPQTLRLLADRRVRTHVLPTQEAVTLYNRLRYRERVAGLFHTTCQLQISVAVDRIGSGDTSCFHTSEQVPLHSDEVFIGRIEVTPNWIGEH